MTARSYDVPFVTFDAGTLTAACVLRPSAAVDRLPPVAGEPSPIAERAREQHGILVGTLRDRGVTVTELEPHTESPTESLLADCALVFPTGAIVARPSQIERRAEIGAVERQLIDLGIPIVGRIAAPGLLDATDVAVAPGTVFVGVPRDGAGLRARSNAIGRAQLASIVAELGYTCVEVAVAAEVPRLRDVLSVIASDTVVVAPDKVDVGALGGLRTIALPRGEEFAAGVLAMGEGRVLANLRFRESLVILRKAKIAVEAIDMWEFGKAGFGPFSLVLAIKRS